MDIKTLIAVATGKIPHNYRSGICPDYLQPDSRDPDCPACKILIEAEHDKIWRPAAYIEDMERELRAAEISLHDVAAHCANVEAELAEIKPAKPATAQVQLNDSEMEMIARAHGTGGWQTLDDMVRFARAIAAAAVRLYAESHPRPIHVTKTDAAKMLGISRPTVDTLIKAGTLSLNRLGKIPISQIDAALVARQ